MIMIESKEICDYFLIKVKTEVIDASNSLLIKNSIIDFIEKGKLRIMLDLTDVLFIDSAALGVFISIFKIIQLRENFILFGLNPGVKRTFEFTSLYKIFTLFQTEREALEFVEKNKIPEIH